MNILFVCHRFPFPPNRGGKIRPFNMISHLARNHSVTVASLAHSAEEMEQGAGLREHCEKVIAEVLPREVRWARMLAALPTPTPSSLAYFRSPRLRSRIMSEAQARHFDVIWVHCAFMAPYVADIPARLRVLDYGDIDSAKWFQYAHERSFPMSLGYALEARKLRRCEIAFASQFDQCTVTTELERDEFSTFGVNVPCTLIPNGVDFKYFQMPGEPADSADPVMAFLGRMDYYPNVEGVRYFVREVFPAIRKAVPNVKFKIIGSDPVAEVRNLARIPGITVTGYVPDVRVHLQDARVAVVPIRICRGTQNKMLESMSMGIPTVASQQASRGIQAIAGRDLLVAEDSADFARKVVALLTDRELHRRIAIAGRQQVTTGHSWARSMKILDSVIETNVAASPA